MRRGGPKSGSGKADVAPCGADTYIDPMVETASAEPPPVTLRLVQVSDCHVSADPQARYRGGDPRAGLSATLHAAKAWCPQLILATGDLSEDGSLESYAWLAGQFEALGAPVLALPGNHDHPRRMADAFSHCPTDDPLVHDVPGWRLILLNSSAEGVVAGRLTERMLSGLADALASHHAAKLVLLHHPPLPVGSPWIDRYMLEAPERLWDLIDRPDVLAVAWGHIHHAVALRHGHARLLGAPATSVNSLPGQQRFTPDPAGPACRWLELRSDGKLETGVLWANRVNQSLGSSNQRMT